MTAKNFNIRIAVVGAGLMGCGVASKFALAGFDVVVYDSDASGLSHIKQNCHAVFLEMAVANLIDQSELAAAEARVRVAVTLAELSESSLVIEAIVESVSAKQSLYASLEAALSDAAIIASSTSAIVPETLSEHLRRPGRFLVAHFWNPPHIIPLVEVVPTLKTEHGTVAATMDWLTSVNCKPMSLRKAVPGFIGNRLDVVTGGSDRWKLPTLVALKRSWPSARNGCNILPAATKGWTSFVSCWKENIAAGETARACTRGMPSVNSAQGNHV
jgi:3-hydroxybutyryl-CoA dehydrogenase